MKRLIYRLNQGEILKQWIKFSFTRFYKVLAANHIMNQYFRPYSETTFISLVESSNSKLTSDLNKLELLKKAITAPNMVKYGTYIA